MVNSNLANDDFIPIMGTVYARDHKREELELAPAPITPHIQNVEEFLVHCRRRKYPSKSTIIYAGDEGDFFGEMGLFGQTDRSAWIRAKTECEVGEISYSKFQELSKDHPEFLFAIGVQMAERLRDTTRKVGDLAFLDVTGRVARTLLDLCKEPDAMTHPDGMQIKITRQEIGRIVGCSREMVGRVLKTLEDQELVSVKGKTMVVFGTR